MRRILLAATVLAVVAAPTVGAAKLPFFGLEVDPLRPSVGERITITMTCYEDGAHARPSASCFGAGDSMAWVHPLDEDGELDRSDWIAVPGHPTPDGSTRGSIVLDEPGPYDVLPLWRRWSARPGDAFPDPVRIEVGRRRGPIPIAIAALGVAAPFLVVALRRRRSAGRSADL